MAIDPEQWAWAKAQYETDCTVTAASLARHLGCTRQAVNKKAKGWNKATNDALEVASKLDITAPVSGSELGKRSPENIAQLINAMALCRNEELACAVVGIDPSTLYRWKQQDTELAKLIQTARARKVTGWLECIDRAANKDWKAAQFQLSRAPETKDIYGETSKEGPRIILNIVRDEVIIDQ